MSAISKEVIALYITTFLCFIVPMLPTVLSTPINKQPITINAPPCGNYGQGNCITNGPPVNPHKNSCNKANYCRNGKWLAPSESINQAPISMAPKALQHHALLQLAFLWLLAFLVFLELNLRFDRDELVCKDALLKAKNLEKKGKSDISCQSTGSHGGEQAAEKCMPKANHDDKLCARNRRCNARSQSMGPSTASQRGGDKEKNENKRHCLRRQPARLRSQGQEPTAENLFEIDDVQFAASQQQGHKMVVVEADGNYVQPFAVDDLDIFSGKSYSVLLRTDQSPSNNYWISVGVRGREPKTPQGLTILNYFPTSASKLPTSQPPVTPRWNDYNHSKAFTKSIFALMGSPQPPKTHHRRIILLNAQNRINGVIKWSSNNISLVLPATPYLGSMKYGLNNAFDQRRPPDNYDSSYDVFKPPVNPTSTHGSGVYTINFDTTVDVILQNANALANNISEIHPWHLHGHDFWVLGYGEGKFREEDEKKFNLKNPPLRNTAVIFPYGWTALRFVADNPGVWALHCHIEPHLHMGMGVVFAEGVHRVGKIPSAALACGLTGNKLN